MEQLLNHISMAPVKGVNFFFLQDEKIISDPSMSWNVLCSAADAS